MLALTLSRVVAVVTMAVVKVAAVGRGQACGLVDKAVALLI